MQRYPWRKLTSLEVFYFPMPPRIMWRSRVAGPDQEANACIYHRLPKLIYVPFAWGDEDQNIWREMKHQGTSTSCRSRERVLRLAALTPHLSTVRYGGPSLTTLRADRLQLLNARAGGISPEECVMPVDLIYGPYDQVGLQLRPHLVPADDRLAGEDPTQCIQR